MNQFNRSDRVNELIHRTISRIIETDLRDERVKHVTVTGVEVTRDLKLAHVYVSVLGDEDETAQSIKTLNHAAGFLRSRLGDEVSMRHTPELQFRYDNSLVEGMRMDRLFEEINQKS